MITYTFTGRAEGDMRSHKHIIDHIHREISNLKMVVRPRQCHKDHIEVVEQIKPGETMMSIADTDGVITRQKNVALTIITADCVPAVFYDESVGMIGASHQGWRGLMAKLPQKMVAEMVRLGAKPESIHVSIGPAINACCYEVHQDRAVQFRTAFPNSEAIIENGDHYFLNLTRLTYEQLVESGIPKQNIELKISCTSCQTDKYYSFRRATDKEYFEEQVSYIVQS